MTRSAHHVVAVLTVALGVTFSASVRADDVDDVVHMINVAGSGADAFGFLRELRSQGDIDLSRREILSAVERTRVQGTLRALLAATSGLRVRGDRVRIELSAPVMLQFGAGALRLDRVVEFRLVGRGGDAVLDRSKGIKVGERRDALYDLKRAVFTRVNGLPVAKVTAGVAFFTRTVTIPLPRAEANEGLAEAPPLPRRRPAHAGALGALDDATGQ